jgi:hypothetical protein
MSIRDRVKRQIRTIKNPLYGIASLLLVIWLIGFLVLNLRGMIHVLLIVAFALILFRLIKARNEVENGPDLN